MAYDPKSHIRLPGTAYIGTGEGSAKSCHAYFTNDDAATVETAGFFNVAYLDFQSGDQINCSLDLDGTPALKSYVVTRTDTVIALTAAAA